MNTNVDSLKKCKCSLQGMFNSKLFYVNVLHPLSSMEMTVKLKQNQSLNILLIIDDHKRRRRE